MNTTDLLCVRKEYCKRSKYVSLKSMLIPPFETGSRELEKDLSFFLYCAPDIASAHSYVLTKNKHDEIIKELFDGRRFVMEDFCAANCKIEKHLSETGLNSNNLCLCCCRLVCKKKRANNGQTESELDCLLRHLRYAIAHGYFHYLHAGNRIYMVFDDFYMKKQTARIVCNKADLEH